MARPVQNIIFLHMFIYLLPFCVAVFIFAAPPHDCSTLVRSGGVADGGSNLTAASDDGGGGGRGLSGDGPSMSIVYDYSSLFPTLTSDVRQSRSH